MAYVLAVAAAALIGVADFAAGIAVRRAGVLPVIVLSRITGLAVLALAFLVFPAQYLRAADLMWGAIAGVAGGSGLAVLYRGLARGVMSAVAPMAAMCAATVPVAVGLFLGDRPAPGALVGVGFGIFAVGLIGDFSATPQSRRGALGSLVRARGSHLAVVSGLGIGLFYVFLAQASSTAGLWPLVAARVAGLAFFLLIGVSSHRRLLPTFKVLPIALVASLFDILGTILYLFAVNRGPLTLVALLTSLYPVSTVALAVLVLGERFSRVRALGFACAVAAVTLIVTA